MSNTSIAAPAMCLFVNALINACSSTIGPRDGLIKRAVCVILSSHAATTRHRARPAAARLRALSEPDGHRAVRHGGGRGAQRRPVGLDGAPPERGHEVDGA